MLENRIEVLIPLPQSQNHGPTLPLFLTWLGGSKEQNESMRGMFLSEKASISVPDTENPGQTVEFFREPSFTEVDRGVYFKEGTWVKHVIYSRA